MNQTYKEALVHLLEEYQLLHLSVGEIGGILVATAKFKCYENGYRNHGKNN